MGSVAKNGLIRGDEFLEQTPGLLHAQDTTLEEVLQKEHT